MRADIDELASALRIDQLKKEIEEDEKVTSDPDFWNDAERSSKVLQKIKQKKDTVSEFEALKNKLEDAITLAEMGIEENDESVVPGGRDRAPRDREGRGAPAHRGASLR